MGEAKIGLRLKFFAERRLLPVQEHRRVDHPGKVIFDPVADIAALVQFGKPFFRAAAKQPGNPRGKKGAFVLPEVAFKHQRKTELVFIAEHEIEMGLAEPFFVRFDSDVRLHHRSAEHRVEFILLQHIVERAERASAGLVRGRTGQTPR